MESDIGCWCHLGSDIGSDVRSDLRPEIGYTGFESRSDKGRLFAHEDEDDGDDDRVPAWRCQANTTKGQMAAVGEGRSPAHWGHSRMVSTGRVYDGAEKNLSNMGASHPTGMMF